MKLKLKSKKVRDVLKDKDLTPSWLARRLNISRSLLGHHLESKSAKHAQEIAGILGVDPMSIVTIEMERMESGVADGISEGKELGEVPGL